MLNIHLNGELVRCPDIKAIHLRRAEQSGVLCRCKYGRIESQCQNWLGYMKQQTAHAAAQVGQYNKLSSTIGGRCMLSGSEHCEHFRFRVNIGNMKKNYCTDDIVYRKIASASHYLIKSNQENKNIFFTLTFPPFHKYLSNNEANKLFSQFFENLRRRRGIHGYVAVRENGTKRGRLHYHCLVNMPYVSFRDLNDYWCSVISDYCNYSANALQTDRHNRIVHDATGAMRYVCKYFTKSRGQKSESRLVFISNNLLSKRVRWGWDPETGEEITYRQSNIKRRFNCEKKYQFLTVNDLLNEFRFQYKQTSDYTTRFRITYHKEFSRFCDEYLYKIFDLSGSDTDLLTG